MVTLRCAVRGFTGPLGSLGSRHTRRPSFYRRPRHSGSEIFFTWIQIFFARYNISTMFIIYIRYVFAQIWKNIYHFKNILWLATGVWKYPQSSSVGRLSHFTTQPADKTPPDLCSDIGLYVSPIWLWGPKYTPAAPAPRTFTTQIVTQGGLGSTLSRDMQMVGWCNKINQHSHRCLTHHSVNPISFKSCTCNILSTSLHKTSQTVQ